MSVPNRLSQCVSSTFSPSAPNSRNYPAAVSLERRVETWALGQLGGATQPEQTSEPETPLREAPPFVGNPFVREGAFRQTSLVQRPGVREQTAEEPEQKRRVLDPCRRMLDPYTRIH